MSSDIRQWLEELELGQYAEAFADNAIDLELLADLSDSDLEKLGVAALGHRKRLLRAIAEMDERQGAAGSSVAAVGSPPESSPAAERRQLTVMFCDLVGSTALSRQMDPEDYRELLAAYRSAASGATATYDGYVAAYMGDGLLVYFGYPQAHEEDAERAVRAGLDIVDAVSALQFPGGTELQVRIGIATGLVVAGDVIVAGASEERAVLGDTPNLAARLQGIAAPNSVVLSDATRRLIEGRFRLEALEPQVLKGMEESVPAYRALAVEETSRFEAAARRGLSTMSGRKSELALLQQHWERTRIGDGQAVHLSGEPGIGKSRLIEEFCGRVATDVSALIRFQCSPYHTGSTFHPFVEHLQRAADLGRDDSTAVRMQELDALVQRSLPETERAAPLLAALLSLPLDPYPPLEMSPQRQRAETINVLVGLLEHASSRGPVVVIFEDAHWIDPSSQEVLAAVIDKIPSLAMLCVISHRPEFSPPWSGSEQVHTVELSRLGRDEVSQIVESVTGGKALPSEMLAQILDRTDGVPLFVEELTKTVLEAGILEERVEGYVLEGPLPSLSIPATLHDSLLARLDRLAPIKEVAQTAACIGRTFSPDLLAAVSPLQGAELDDAMEQLVDAELVFRQNSGDAVIYSFKHALVQDAAYESLLVSRRRVLHAHIAEVIEARFPEISSAEPERLAQHYTSADMAEEAIPCWLSAGRKALASLSLSEAVIHLSKALELTTSIEDAADRAEHEVEVRTALGAATMALYGWPAREMREVVEPACDLFEQGYGDSSAFMNLWNLWVHHGCRAEHREGLTVVDRMLKYSGARNDPVLALISSFTASLANLWAGNYDAALTHESAALEVYDFERDRHLVWDYNHDPKNTLLSWAATRVWALGFPDQARLLSDQAVAHARRVGHPFNLCWTLGNSSIPYGACGDYDKAVARIDELRDIAQEQELLFMDAYMAPGTMCVAATHGGDYQVAYEEGARAEEIWRSIGGRFWSPVVRAHMAQACLHLERTDEALALVHEAIELMESTGELMMAGEIYRIAGLVHLDLGDEGKSAEPLFEKSLAFSKRHGTRSFELRTAICMARLCLDQGKPEKAVNVLAPVYDWFDEGFDTHDLRDAKALLDELA